MNFELIFKVSLIYLLREKEAEARDEIRDLLLSPRTHKPILDWAQEQQETTGPWRRQLLEALSIIQNYHILKTKFGK